MWTGARKELEWTNTVQFLQSMGLDQSKMGISREQVERGFQQVPTIQKLPAAGMLETPIEAGPVAIPA
jgi:glycerol-3-phosphate dehydrogenase